MDPALNRVFITTSSIISAVGLDAPSTCAALRCGISGFSETTYLDNQGEPLIGAVVPTVPLTLRPSERIEAMLRLAMTELVRLRPQLDRRQVPLLLGIAEPERPGALRSQVVSALISRIEESLGRSFDRARSQVLATGHTAAFRALDRARTLLTQVNTPACLVACVDSYINAESLAWLDEHQRLKTPDNSDGVIPGEAAACLLVERTPSPEAPSAQVLSLGFGYEEVTVLAPERPLLGLGMTAAVRAALAAAGLGLHGVDQRIADVSGEEYGFRELSLALSRTLRARRAQFDLWHPADGLGDTGAASGCVQLTMFAAAADRGFVHGPIALCHASSVSGDRGVAALRAVVR